ncbi:MAG: S-adenosylmethionine decarboxylase [bacterium]|nr:S-adenosylmethionine decarboxylase [bacterium]
MEKAKMKGPRKIFGYHMILDCYGCDPKAVDSVEICYYYLDKITEVLKVHKQSPPFVVYTDPLKYPEKAGISGWVPIVESGVSIHTLTPTDFVSIDVYSCKKYNVEKVRDFTRKVFQPKEIEEKFFLRGEKYIHPTKAEARKKIEEVKHPHAWG